MKQIAFPLEDSNNIYDLDEYIVSSSNNIAYTILNNWPKSWGVEPYAKTLILQGPKLSGKTFLAKKWAEKSGALFLTKEQELNENLLNKYHAFIIDGFNSEWEETKILHYFNIINENNKYLLITTTNLPGIKLPDLSSRIKATNLVNIDMLDEELMKILIFKLFSNYSITVSNEVISYLLKHLPRSFPEITKSIKKLNLYALENKRKITIPLIKKVL